MEQISTEILHNAVRANCFPRGVKERVYVSPDHAPYQSAATMRVLMECAGYDEDQIQLEIGMKGHSWERISDEIIDMYDGKNTELAVKVKLCRNYLKLNHSINLQITL